MEAQGAGMQVLMSAKLALEMGCPIFAVIGLVNTATDKEGRSVPAPGQGILTTAREVKLAYDNPMLSVAHRKRRLERALRNLDESTADERDEAKDLAAEMLRAARAKIAAENDSSVSDRRERRRIEKLKAAAAARAADFLREREELCAREEARARSGLLSRYGNDFFLNDHTIAPLRGALAVWGLSVDDIGMASFHGTGTKANDINESKVTDMQMRHLGRTAGKPLLVVAQKWLTGHPKGAAAAWMTNGVCQSLTTGVVPGNRNADNIDEELRQFEHLCYPNRSVKTAGIDAAVLKSFGFGQAGAEVLLVHPKFLLASIGADARRAYAARRADRQVLYTRAVQRVVTGKAPLVNIKSRAPYTEAQQNRVYLDPSARCVYDSKLEDYAYPDEETEAARARRERGERAAAVMTLSARKASVYEDGRRESKVEDGSSGGMLRSPSTQKLRQIDEVLMYSMGKDQKKAGAGATAPDPETFAARPSAAAAATKKAPSRVLSATRLAVAMREAAEDFHGAGSGIGIDAEDSKTFVSASEPFLDRNFTTAERRYAEESPDPAHALAGRWAAKEAVIKALSSLQKEDAKNLWVDASAPLKDIEIIRTTGAPFVRLWGHAKKVSEVLGVSSIKVSISHSGSMALAQALALR